MSISLDEALVERAQKLEKRNAELQARVEELEREQWLVAECIFQNVSGGEMKHWAEGIKCSLTATDRVPRFTVDTASKLRESPDP